MKPWKGWRRARVAELLEMQARRELGTDVESELARLVLEHGELSVRAALARIRARVEGLSP